jgi:NADH dehydrogenase (ubiquinone) Fe-S protein 6
MQANDPSPKPAPQNVSGTNALEVDAGGLRDAPLQELPEEAEKQRQMQAPNRATRWSPSQQPRDKAMSGPRFEQTIMEFQVSTPHCF